MSDEKKNDGGPAFPGYGEQFVEGVHGIQPQSAYGMEGSPGMTLRDYFAAKADLGKVEFADLGVAEGLMGRKMPTDDVAETIGWQAELTAKLRYMMADAMIKAREE